MSRFVVIVAPAGLPVGATRVLDASDLDALPYRPTSHVRWSDRSHTVHFASWEHGTPTSTVDARGLTAFAGMPRPRRGVWPADRPQRVSVGEHLWSSQVGCHDLADAFAAVRLDADGEGLVFGDPLGIHPLYEAVIGEIQAFGNRPDLVAEIVAACTGRPAARDLRTSALLAFTGYLIGDSTGYEAVTLLPQDTHVEISGGRVVRKRANPVYAEVSDPVAADPHLLADELTGDIEAALRHALVHTSDRADLELTGGKDSRVVFAVAVHAGLADQFRIVTYGVDGSSDREVAADIAMEFGLPHHDISDLHYRRAAEISPVERFRRHVHRTSGMSFCGTANEPRDPGPLTVSGLMGEPFRTANERLARSPVVSRDDAVERFRVTRKFGSAGSVRADVGVELFDAAVAFYMEVTESLRSLNDLHGAFFLRCRLPRWQGPLVDLQEHLVRPFYSPDRLRSAFSVGFDSRTAEETHLAIIRAASPALVTLPLADGHWRTLPPPPESAPTTATGDAVGAAADIRTGRSATANAVMEIVGDDAGNPLFDLVDRAAALEAAADFDTLSRFNQHEILGLTTGLIWHARAESPSRHLEVAQ